MIPNIDPAVLEQRIEQVRRFHRLYERHICEVQDRAVINELSWEAICAAS